MAGQIMSFEVMTSQPTDMVSFCRASFGLSDQCKFISLCLNRRKTQGGFIHPVQGLKSIASLKTFKQNWTFLVSFLKPTFLWVCRRIIQRDPTYYSAVWKGQLAFQFNMENYARFTKQFYLT